MSTVREKVGAFRALLEAQKASTFRMALSTPDATALVTELAESEPEVLRHPAELQAALAGVIEAGEQPTPDEGDVDAKLAWSVNLAKATDAFWSVFEGQVVDGVELIRRR